MANHNWLLENAEITKILDIENDGVNMAVDGQFLYIRCKRAMGKYNLTDMSLAAHNVIFKKDGKARGFAIYGDRVFLTNFCDLYILNKSDLQIQDVLRMGADLSSDIWGSEFNAGKAYIALRNGKMALLDIDTKRISIHEISDSSFWDYCVVDNRIYAGTVKGELIEADTDDMRVIRKVELCKKNIYSVVFGDGMIYTVSQDTSLKAVDAASLETVCVVKKAVRGMAKIIGIYKDVLVVADSGQIALWDTQTLQPLGRFAFPCAFNKGVMLHGNTLYGSDYQSVYSVDLE